MLETQPMTDRPQHCYWKECSQTPLTNTVGNAVSPSAFVSRQWLYSFIIVYYIIAAGIFQISTKPTETAALLQESLIKKSHLPYWRDLCMHSGGKERFSIWLVNQSVFFEALSSCITAKVGLPRWSGIPFLLRSASYELSAYVYFLQSCQNIISGGSWWSYLRECQECVKLLQGKGGLISKWR